MMSLNTQDALAGKVGNGYIWALLIEMLIF